jgi:hypothetical protein
MTQGGMDDQPNLISRVMPVSTMRAARAQVARDEAKPYEQSVSSDGCLLSAITVSHPASRRLSTLAASKNYPGKPSDLYRPLSTLE